MYLRELINKVLVKFRACQNLAHSSLCVGGGGVGGGGDILLDGNTH